MNPETEKPLGWPKGENIFPEPQGEYYCGLGTGNVEGREIVEMHLKACLNAGIDVTGTNTAVPGTGTKFLTELSVGDSILVSTETREIEFIENPYSIFCFSYFKKLNNFIWFNKYSIYTIFKYIKMFFIFSF